MYNDKLFKIIKLPVLLPYRTKACVPIITIYVEESKMYIYVVDEDIIMRRLLITLDGKKKSYETIIETEYVCILLS